MPEVIGIDHIYIAVSDMDKSDKFYDIVLSKALGFKKSAFDIDGERHIHYYNRHFSFVLRPALGQESNQDSPGMHHFCFRVETVEDLYELNKIFNANAVQSTEVINYPQYANDYWAIFFSDPDGLQLEVTNYREERKSRYENWI